MTNSETLWGYIAAAVVGVTLGLTGGGGSILTIPVLVYLLGIAPVLATAYSLFVVGVTSLVGSFNFMRQKLVHFKAAVVYATPSMISVYLTRSYILPLIPDTLIVGRVLIKKGEAIMILFALVMLIASFSMIRAALKSPKQDDSKAIVFKLPVIAMEGAIIGFVTGFLGAGGGFLIVPALVLLSNLPMRLAVGTSLFIIAINSLTGFVGDLGQHEMDYRFLFVFTGISILGIFIGSYSSRFISPRLLKVVFGCFVALMAVMVLLMEMRKS